MDGDGSSGAHGCSSGGPSHPAAQMKQSPIVYKGRSTRESLMRGAIAVTQVGGCGGRHLHFKKIVYICELVKLAIEPHQHLMNLNVAHG